MTLQHLKEAAYRAHYHTSFVPEKRAEQTISEHEEMLREDIKELQKAGVNEETQNEYSQKFASLYSKWLYARSRVLSPMITGPARFPVERNKKALRSEENHYTVFQEWRSRAKKAIIRKAIPRPTFLSEIDRYRADLENLKANHEKMKEGNKKIRQAQKTGEDLSEYLTKEFGIAPHMIDWTMMFGFGTQNNLANIKRVEEMIKVMEAKEQRANNTGQECFKFEGFSVIYNHEADRIQIKHDSRPDHETISKLKHGGFRWSPSYQAWQRQLNNNGIAAAKRLLGVGLKYLN